MKSLFIIAAILLGSSAFAAESTTTTAFIRGNSMDQVEANVQAFLAKLPTQQYIKGLLPSECNPSNDRRVERSAYSIQFFNGSNSYTVTGTGKWVQNGPMAHVKVKCKKFSGN